MKKILFIIFVLVLAVGCESILDVKPRASVTDDQVLNDLVTTQATLTGCYSVLRSANYYGRSLVLLPELLSDNCKLANASDRSGRGQNEAANVKGSAFVHWNTLYAGLNSINLVIDAVESQRIPIITSGDQISLNRIKAQAFFLRALFHFDLVKAYAYNPNYIIKDHNFGVPVVLKPTKGKGEIQLLERPPIVDVYTQIEADLLASIDLFTQTGAPNSLGSYLATRGGARALLARVYLNWAGPVYPTKYQDAINASTDAINDLAGFAPAVALSTTGNFNANWVTTTQHPESLFEVRFASTAENLGGDNSLEGWYTRRFTATGARTGWGDVVASDELVAAYSEVGDLRLGNGSNTVLSFTTPGVRPSEPSTTRETRKFSAIASPTTFGLDNVPVIRLAEMFLIRAEASALSPTPNEAQARTDLNTIRGRVGLGAVSGTLTGTALTDLIYLERRRELAHEGHRWFDFIRRGLAVNKPGGNTIPYSDDRILANIPLDQIQANPKLKQNPGY
jgi:starch-binding outer membrane protein, SusD/RagB family